MIFSKVLMSLEDASNNGFKKIILAAFFGKAVKMAQGVPHTHAAKSSLTMKKLSDWSFEITKSREFAGKILSANTARHAFDFIMNEYPQIISCVGRKMVKAAGMFTGSDIDIQGIIFDFSGDVVFDSDDSRLKQT